MNYTNFNMRLDNELRGRAYPILEQYGLTPSQAVRMFFNQIAQTGKVPLSFDWADKQTLTPKLGYVRQSKSLLMVNLSALTV